MKLINKQQNTMTKAEKGFAMLFAVLISSVLLSIGLSIFNLTIKELTLSSSGRESQFAFYAADTGIECAFYWDFKGVQIFATSSSARSPSPASPDCVDTAGTTTQAINITPSLSDATSATTTLSLTIPNLDAQGASAPYCVNVTVVKRLVAAVIQTTVDSRGYNTCDTTDINRVERAIRVTY